MLPVPAEQLMVLGTTQSIPERLDPDFGRKLRNSASVAMISDRRVDTSCALLYHDTHESWKSHLTGLAFWELSLMVCNKHVLLNALRQVLLCHWLSRWIDNCRTCLLVSEAGIHRNRL